jgi:hypothetical protein
MKLLKAKIREGDAVNLDKLVLWAACTLLFHGAFRGGEIFSRTAAYFDPAFTLLREDITMVTGCDGRKVVQVRLKAPKEDRNSSAIIVDVFQTDM